MTNVNSDTYRPAGTYNLKSFRLESFTDEGGVLEMNKLVHVWELSETVKKGNVQGEAKIYDSVGAFYNFPIRGQEILTIEYIDYREIERQEKYFVYAVTDVKPSSDNDDSVLEYILHFVSLGKFLSERYSISRCIADGTGSTRTYIPISAQANTIFQDYYNRDEDDLDKEIVVHDTDGPQKIVIPNMKPENAMHLLSRKAYSAEYPSSMFRFFENRDKFYFANIERLLVDAEVEDDQFFFYSTILDDVTPEGELFKMNSIISVDFGNTVNTLRLMNEGAYNRSYVEVDPLTRTLSNFDYNHLEEKDNFVYPDVGRTVKVPHSNTMVQSHLNKTHKTYGIKDYGEVEQNNPPGLRPTTFYPEVYNHKQALMQHYGQSEVTIQIYGSNKVFAGSVILVEFPKMQVTAKIDLERSGRYFVESVRNVFFENTYTQTLKISKGGRLESNRGIPDVL